MSIESNYKPALKPNQLNLTHGSSLDAVPSRDETSPARTAHPKQLYNELCLQYNITLMVNNLPILKQNRKQIISQIG